MGMIFQLYVSAGLLEIKCAIEVKYLKSEAGEILQVTALKGKETVRVSKFHLIYTGHWRWVTALSDHLESFQRDWGSCLVCAEHKPQGMLRMGLLHVLPFYFPFSCIYLQKQ